METAGGFRPGATGGDVATRRGGTEGGFRTNVAGGDVATRRGGTEGGVRATTVIDIDTDATTPETPLAVNVTTVVPRPKNEPLGAELVTLILELATSVAVGGLKKTTAPRPIAWTTRDDGGLCSTGVSRTSTR